MASSCDICCEPFNRTTHTSIQCLYTECGFRACKACMRQYILTVSTKAHCMSCKKEWPTNFLVSNLNRSFVGNEYAKQKKKLFLEREVSKLPETMEYATLSKEHNKMEAIEREKCEKYAEEIKKVRNLIAKLKIRKDNLQFLKDKHAQAAREHKNEALRPSVSKK